MFVAENFTILQPEIGHTFGLNYSNDNNIRKNSEPILQVQHMRKNEYILGIGLENDCVDRDWCDDEY